MRGALKLLTLGLMLAGGFARAQILDPNTGIEVDATTDPVDYVNALSGQPTNIGAEANAAAVAQMQAAQQQMAQAEQVPSNPFPASDNTGTQPAAAVWTPKPSVSPKSGNFHGSLQVTLADRDARATIYYTTDGSKPTQASPVYLAPLVITAKTRVRALAVEDAALPSAVASKTFRVKS